MKLRFLAMSRLLICLVFAHNASYTGGNGGTTGVYNYVNIAQVKLNALS